jgi:hypothetical protein
MIKVKEEVKIPDTDIILEAGDTIEVIQESTLIYDKYIFPALNNLFNHPTNWINKLVQLLNDIEYALNKAAGDKIKANKLKGKFILLLRQSIRDSMRKLPSTDINSEKII